MQKYIGTIRHLTHYEQLPTPPMAIQGWVRLIQKLGGHATVDDTSEGVIDITVPICDPRDGHQIGTQAWTLIPHEGWEGWGDCE